MGFVSLHDSCLDPRRAFQAILALPLLLLLTTCNLVSVGLGAKVDVAPPSVNIATPANGQHLKGVVAISGPATDDTGVESVSIAVTIAGASKPVEVPATIKNSTWNGVLDTASLANGGEVQADVVVTCTDVTGKTSDKRIRLYFDNVKPVITSLDPTQGTLEKPETLLSGTVAFNGSVKDGFTVASLSFVAGGIAFPIAAGSNTSAWRVEVNTAKNEAGQAQFVPNATNGIVDLGGGLYKVPLVIVATDDAGNNSDPINTYFYVDQNAAAPRVTFPATFDPAIAYPVPRPPVAANVVSPKQTMTFRIVDAKAIDVNSFRLDLYSNATDATPTYSFTKAAGNVTVDRIREDPPRLLTGDFTVAIPAAAALGEYRLALTVANDAAYKLANEPADVRRYPLAGSAALSLMIANGAPTTLVTAPTNGDFVKTLAAAGTSEDGIGIDRVELSVDGGTTWNPAALATMSPVKDSWSWTAALPEGGYTLKVRGVNAAIIRNEPPLSLQFTVDKSAPTLQVTGISPASADTSLRPAPFADVSDGTVPGGIRTTINGVARLRGLASDNYVLDHLDWNFTKNDAAKTVMTSGSLVSAQATVWAIDLDTTSSTGGLGLADGSYVFNATAFDKAGNSTLLQRTLVVDQSTDKPGFTIKNMDATVSTSAQAGKNLLDSGARLDAVVADDDWVDNSRVQILIDQATAPMAADWAGANAKSVTWGTTQADGSMSFTYRLDSNTNGTVLADGRHNYYLSSWDSADGARGRKAGKAPVQSVVGPVWFAIDRNPPAIAFDQGGQGLYVNSSQGLSGRVSSGVNVTSLVVTPQGQAASPNLVGVSSANVTWNYSVNVLTVPEGPLPIAFLASDEFGKTSSQTFTVTVDKTPPTVSFISVAPQLAGAKVNGIIQVDGSSSDLNPIDSLDYLIDPTNNPLIDDPKWSTAGITGTSSRWTFQIDTRALSSGNHDIAVRATDRAGNHGIGHYRPSSGSSFSINVDQNSDLPTINLGNADASPAGPDALRDASGYVVKNAFSPGNATLMGSVADDDWVDASSIKSTIEKGSYSAVTSSWSWSTVKATANVANQGTSGTLASFTENIGSLADGFYRITFRASDTNAAPAGDVSGKKFGLDAVTATTSPIYFGFDSGAPTLSVTSVPTATNGKAPIALLGTVSDGNAVKKVLYGLDSNNYNDTGYVAGGTWSASLTLAGPDGTKTVFIKAVDEFKNEAVTSQSILFDSTPPLPAITLPSSGGILSGNAATIGGTVADNVGGSGVSSVECQLVLGSGSPSSGSWRPASLGSGWSALIDTTVMAEGSYTLYVRASDKAGNTSADLATKIAVMVDQGPPILVPMAQAAIPYRTPFVLAGTVSDPGDASVVGATNGVASLRVSIDDASMGSSVAATSTAAGGFTQGPGWSFDPTAAGAAFWSALADGSHTLYLRATDKAGRTSDASWAFVKDTTAPTISPVGITKLLAGGKVNGMVSLGGTAADNLTLDRVDLAIVGTNPAGGVYGGTQTFSGAAAFTWNQNLDTHVFKDLTPVTITATAWDKAGNSSSSTASFTVDQSTDLPTAVLASADPSGTSVASLRDASGYVVKNVFGPTNYQFTGHVTDDDWVSASSLSLSLEKYDGVSAWNPVTGYGKPLVVGASSLDVSFSLDLSALSDGFYRATLGGQDDSARKAGLPAASMSPLVVYFGYDSGAPSVSVTAAPSATNGLAPVNLSGTVTDGNAVKRVQSSVDGSTYTDLPGYSGGGVWNLSRSLTGPDGTKKVYIKAIDEFRNETVTSQTILFDSTPPTVAVSAPLSASWVGGVSLAIVGTSSDPNGAAGSGVSKAYYKIDLAANNHAGDDPATWTIVPTAGNWSDTLDTTTFAEGDYKLWYAAGDNAGNRSTISSIAFGIDRAPPALAETIVNTQTTVYKVADFSLSGTVSDTNGLAALHALQVSVDGGAPVDLTALSGRYSGSVVGQNWTMTVNVAGASLDGLHSYVFTATDVAGKQTIITRNISIDTIPASLTVNKPSVSSWVSGANYTISGSADDGAGSGVAKVYYLVDAAAVDHGSDLYTTWVQAAGTTTWSGSIDLFALGEGAKRLWVKSVDKAGNVNTSATTVDFEVDQNNPTLAETTVSLTSTVTRNGNVVFGGTAGDTNALAATNALTVSVDNGAATAIPLSLGAWSWTYAVAGHSQDGIHGFTFVATDVAGKTTVVNRSALVDTTEASVSVTSPAANSYTNNTTIALSGSANDGSGSGVKEIWYYLDTSPATHGGDGYGAAGWTKATGGTPTNWNASLPGTAQGAYTLLVKALDNAGNYDTVATAVAFTVDTTPPALSEASPTTTAGIAKAGFSFGATSGASTDALSGVQSFTVSDNGGAPQTLTPGTAWTWAVAVDTSGHSYDGTHNYLFTLIDKAGNQATLTRTILVDTTPPAALVFAPAANMFSNSTTVSLSGTANDGTGSGASQVWYRVDTSTVDHSADAYNAAGWAQASGAATWTASVTGLTEGVKKLWVKTLDNAGNVTSAAAALSGAVVLTIDLTPPTLSESSAATVAGMARTGFTFGATSGAATDALSGIQSFTMNDNGGPASVVTPGPNWTAAVAIDTTGHADDGSHTYHFTLTDWAGNQTTITRTILVDTTEANVSVASPAANLFTNSTTINLAGSANDGSGTGVKEIWYYIDANPPTHATDSYGAPGWTKASGGTPTNWSAVASGVAEGGHSLLVKVLDNAGNYSASATVSSFTVDTTPPTLTESSPTTTAGSASADFGFGATSGAATDALSGVQSFTMSDNGGSPVALVPGTSWTSAVAVDKSGHTKDGSHTYLFTLTDKAGNQTTLARTILIDTREATTTLSSPAAGSFTNVTTIGISGTANDGSGSGVKEIWYYVDAVPATHAADAYGALGWVKALGGTPTNWDSSALGVTQGPHTLLVKVLDEAGNYSAGATAATFTVDTTPPVLTEASPTTASGSAKSGFTLGLSGAVATDSLSGIQSFTVSDNGGAPVAVTPGAAWTWPVAVDAAGHSNDGSHTYLFTLSDKAGNQTTLTRTVVIDSIEASATVVSPSAGAFTNNPILAISGSANDGSGSGVKEIWYYIDASPATHSADAYGAAGWIKATGGMPTNWSANTAALPQGAYTLLVKVLDNAGNYSASAVAAAFTVDTTAPVLSESSPTTTAGIAGANFTFGASSGAATDALSGVLSFTVSDNGGAAVAVTPGAAWTWAVAVDGVGHTNDGTHTYLFVLTDKAGNKTTLTRTINIDTTPASATVFAPAANIFSNSTTIALSGTANDGSGSGVSQVWYRVDASGVDHSADAYNGAGWAMATGAGTWTGSVAALTEGAKKLWVKTVDNAGNVTSAASALTGAVTFTVDLTAPVLSEGSPTTTSGNAKAGFSFGATSGVATDALSGVQSFTMSDNGGAPVAVTPGPNWTMAIAVDTAGHANDGSHTYLFTLTDWAGNKSTLTRTVLIDSTPAAASVSQPAASSYASSALTISGSANDGSGTGLSQVWYRIDSSAVDHSADIYNSAGWTQAAGTTTWSASVTGLTEGTKKLWIKTLDNAGNVTSPAAASATALPFTVDLTPPALAETGVGTTTSYSGNFTFVGTATDGIAMAATHAVQVSVDGAAAVDVSAVSPWSFAVTVNPVTHANDGTHNYVFIATDASGKTATLSRTVQIDTYAPTVTYNNISASGGTVFQDAAGVVTGGLASASGLASTSTLLLEQYSYSSGTWSTVPAFNNVALGISGSPKTFGWSLNMTFASGAFPVGTSVTVTNVGAGGSDWTSIGGPNPVSVGSVFTPTGNGSAFTGASVSLADGRYRLGFVAANVTSPALTLNTTAAPVTFLWSRSSPTVSIATPGIGTYQNGWQNGANTGTFTLIGSSSDPNSITGVSARLGALPSAAAMATTAVGNLTNSGVFTVASLAGIAAYSPVYVGNNGSGSQPVANGSSNPLSSTSVYYATQINTTNKTFMLSTTSGVDNLLSFTNVGSNLVVGAATIPWNATTVNWMVPAMSLAAASDGPATVVVTATAGSSKTGLASRDFTKDTTAPAIAVSSPPLNNKVVGNLSIAGTSSDPGANPSGVASVVQYALGKSENPATNLSPSWTNATGGAYSWTINLTAAALSVYSRNVAETTEVNALGAPTTGTDLWLLPVYLKTLDNAGNVQIKTDYSLILDPNGNTPVITLIQPLSSGASYGGQVRISGTASQPIWINSVEVAVDPAGGNNFPQTPTAIASIVGTTINAPSHPFTVGQMIFFAGTVQPQTSSGSVATTTPFYVLSTTAGSFTVSAASGGAAQSFTSGGTSVTASVWAPAQIVSPGNMVNWNYDINTQNQYPQTWNGFATSQGVTVQVRAWNSSTVGGPKGSISGTMASPLAMVFNSSFPKFSGFQAGISPTQAQATNYYSSMTVAGTTYVWGTISSTKGLARIERIENTLSSQVTQVYPDTGSADLNSPFTNDQSGSSPWAKTTVTPPTSYAAGSFPTTVKVMITNVGSSNNWSSIGGPNPAAVGAVFQPTGNGVALVGATVVAADALGNFNYGVAMQVDTTKFFSGNAGTYSIDFRATDETAGAAQIASQTLNLNVDNYSPTSNGTTGSTNMAVTLSSSVFTTAGPNGLSNGSYVYLNGTNLPTTVLGYADISLPYIVVGASGNSFGLATPSTYPSPLTFTSNVAGSGLYVTRSAVPQYLTGTVSIQGSAQDVSPTVNIGGLKRVIAYLEQGGSIVNMTNGNLVAGGTYPVKDMANASIAAAGTLQNAVFPANLLVTAGAFTSGHLYKIVSPGNTDFRALFGAPDNNSGTKFTATGPGTGGGTAIDYNVASSYAASMDDNTETGFADVNGDGWVETFGTSGNATNWSFSFDTARVKDGNYSVHYVVFDNAGNATHYKQLVFVANNGPKFTGVQLGTDVNGDGAIAVGEVGSSTNATNTNFTVRNKLFSITPNLTYNGANNGALVYALDYSTNGGLSWTNYPLPAFGGSSFGVSMTNSYAPYHGGETISLNWNSLSPIIADVAANGGTFRVTVTDATLQYAQIQFNVGIQNTDSIAPTIDLAPFGKRYDTPLDLANLSVNADTVTLGATFAASLPSSVVYVPANPFAVGDVVYFGGASAPQIGGLPVSPSTPYFVVGSTASSITVSTVYGGAAANFSSAGSLVTVTGSIKSLVPVTAYTDNVAGTTGNLLGHLEYATDSQYNPLAVNLASPSTGGFTNSGGNNLARNDVVFFAWTTAPSSTENGTGPYYIIGTPSATSFQVSSTRGGSAAVFGTGAAGISLASADVSGQVILRGKYYDNQRIQTLTATIAGFNGGAGAGLPFTVATWSAAANAGSGGLVPSTGANWTFAIDSGSESVSAADGQAANWSFTWDTSKLGTVDAGNVSVVFSAVDFNGGTGSTGTTVDVVPYISKVTTSLAASYSSNPSVLNRSANGAYPVREGEIITIDGFNFNGASTNVTVGANAAQAATLVAGKTTTEVTWTVPGVNTFGSGNLKVTVASIDSVNNSNSNARAWNQEANGLNNNTLTDDRVLRIWKITQVLADTTVRYPTMRVASSATAANQFIGWAYDNSENFFSMTRTSTHAAAQFESNPTRYYDTAFAFDEQGDTYGEGNSGDITAGGGTISNWSSAGFFWSQPGTQAGTYSGGYSAGTYKTRFASLSSDGTSANTNSNRFQNPDMVAALATPGSALGTGNKAMIYLSYYDAVLNQVMLRTGSVDGTSGGGTTMAALAEKGTSSSAPWDTPGAIAIAPAATSGAYSSIALSPVDRATLVAVWYDSNNRRLLYSYNTQPTVAGQSGQWTANTKVVDSALAGWYGDVIVDTTGAVHIAYYRTSTGDLCYASLPTVASSTFSLVTVDSFLSVGQNISIGVLNNGSAWVPYISYFSGTFTSTSASVKIAYRSDMSSLRDGATNDLYTNGWEVMTLPLSNIPKDFKVSLGFKDFTGAGSNLVPVLGYATNTGLEYAYAH